MATGKVTQLVENKLKRADAENVAFAESGARGGNVFAMGKLGVYNCNNFYVGETATGWTTVAKVPEDFKGTGNYNYGQCYRNDTKASNGMRVSGQNVQIYSPEKNTIYYGQVIYPLA